MATTAGAGSVWNANSWHWEEKNYTRWSTEYLQQRLAAGTVLAAAGGLTIEVAGDVEVKGEASVSIRKQKLILAVDLLLSFRWEAFRTPAAAAGDSAAATSDQNKVTTASGELEAGAEAKTGAGDRGEAADERQRRSGPRCCCCRGQVKLEDISVDSIEDSDYRLTVSGAPSSSETAPASEQERQQCVQLLKKQGAKLLQQILTQYIQQLREAEASAERLAADKRLREEELQRTKVAEETKGEEKKQIAAEEKEKDKLFREQEKIKHVLAGETTAAAQPANSSRVTPLEGQGSVWNPSSYHWEEKPMTSWCQATLKERLSSAEFKILDNSTTVKFFNISIEGEASNTIRKGRKLVIFDLSIGADWTATARDEAGVFLADSRGRLEISDFTSETTDEYQLSINGDGKLPAQQRIDSAAKKELPPLLQQLLSQFIQDLRARG